MSMLLFLNTKTSVFSRVVTVKKIVPKALIVQQNTFRKFGIEYAQGAARHAQSSLWQVRISNREVKLN
jgi:hypothetical protein